MLVLSRKRQEAVVVGVSGGFEQLLKVTVLEICGGNVKLGFEADSTVPVHRWEVWERLRADRIEARLVAPRHLLCDRVYPRYLLCCPVRVQGEAK